MGSQRWFTSTFHSRSRLLSVSLVGLSYAPQNTKCVSISNLLTTEVDGKAFLGANIRTLVVFWLVRSLECQSLASVDLSWV